MHAPGDGELFTWGDATHGKTLRRDQRTTFVPWKVEASDMFVTEVSVGTHHALGLCRLRTWMLTAGARSIRTLSVLRIWFHYYGRLTVCNATTDSETDRWRTVPLGPIASYLEPTEGMSGSASFLPRKRSTA